MGRIVVTEFISIDGVVEAPGGEEFRHPNWSFTVNRGEAGEQYKLNETLEASALLIGRKTYEGFSAAWPKIEGEFADKYNTMPKYVISQTLVDPTWNNTSVLSGDVIEEVQKLKADVPGDISVAGSIQLVQTLLAADLVDEIHLMTTPVILGHGRKLWSQTPDMTTWRLADVQTFGDGIPLVNYIRDR